MGTRLVMLGVKKVKVLLCKAQPPASGLEWVRREGSEGNRAPGFWPG